MNEEQARQFIRALFHLVWEKRDKSKIPTFYAANLTGFVDQMPLKIRDIYDGVDYIAKNCYSNVYSVHDLVVSENKIAAVVNVKTISIDQETERYTSIAYFYELSKGKIVKLRMYVGEPQVNAVEQESNDPNGSLISRAVDAVSNLTKPKQAKSKPAVENKKPIEKRSGEDRRSEEERRVEEARRVKENKVEEERRTQEDRRTAEERRNAKERRNAEDRRAVESEQPEAKKANSDYSASPQPAFSFNKAKLQVGVNPAKHLKDKDSD
ncbi:MAG: hypothetical protein P1U40_06095 [Coxiellaceae bacterium]|nr:hypothetical protein [Coxiellaceae bacterium]